MPEQNNSYEEQFKHLEKALKQTRLFSIISGFFALACMVLLVLVLVKVIPMTQAIYSDVYPVVTELQKVDADALQKDIDTIGGQLEQVDVQLLMTTLSGIETELSQVDWEALNKTLQELDAEQLTELIVNLNTAIDTINGIAGKLGSFSIFK